MKRVETNLATNSYSGSLETLLSA